MEPCLLSQRGWNGRDKVESRLLRQGSWNGRDEGRWFLPSRTEAGIEESKLTTWLDWDCATKSWIGLACLD